jgi:uncharacterized repeat protein (TIGR01451 family)
MRLLAMIRRVLLSGLALWLLAALVPGTAAAATCGAATAPGTAAPDFRDYCWFDFSGFSNATARSSAGQPFTFNLPDGTVVKMTVRVGAYTSLDDVAAPSWTGSAFGKTAFLNIPGRPILYTTGGGTHAVGLSITSVTPPNGGTASYSIVVADGESSNDNESVAFTTTGNAWTQVAQIPNGTSTTYPSVSHTNGNKTVTLGGQPGQVGSYAFRSDGNPAHVGIKLAAGGLQGVIVGMRYASISVVSQVASQRYNAADQFSYKVGTSGGSQLAAGATSGTALNGFTPAVVPTVAASYPFVVSQSLAAGSVGTAANYTTTLTCVNANTGSSTALPSNQVASSFQFNSLNYGDSILCTFTNTPNFNTIVGTVYGDANHNGSQDGTETGPGAGFYVKLAPVTNGACASPAAQFVAVDAATGAYTLGNLSPGSYCVILDNNNTLSDIASTLPAGWIPTESPAGVLQVVVPAGSSTSVPRDFGLYKGSRLAGTVFADTGVGAGTPNNGVKDGTEAGLGNVAVTASTGATAVATATTAGDGSFTLWLPATVSGLLTVVPTTPSGHLATGGSAGSTGGAYARPNITYTPVAGQSHTGVGFGFATPNTLAPNGAQTAQPGTVVFYAHTFTAGSGGQVSFSLANAAQPANPAWSTVLYRDTNCSAALDGAEPLVNATLTVTAGQQVCLLVKQFVPAGAPLAATNIATLTAVFTYTNAAPAMSSSLTVTDVTTGGEPDALALKKLVGNVTRGGAAATSVTASPGEVLQYTVTAQNNGGTSLSTLVINDATPAFTAFVAAACPAPLPAGITACTISNQPAAGGQGGVQWTFTGTLASGGQLAVTYQVKVSQ